MSFTKDNCYTSSGKYCSCIEFHLDDEHRHGLNTSQLIDYTLEPGPDTGEDKNAPLQKLALAFSTADVVIMGTRLGKLADKLRENDLATIRVLPKRFADLDSAGPFVSSIAITPISRP